MPPWFHRLSFLIILGLSCSLNAGQMPGEMRNFVANGDFSQGSVAGLPDGWTVVCPNPALAPTFQLETNSDGHRSLTATGNGREECFGYVRHKVHIDGGKSYRMTVRFRTEGLDDVNRHLVHGVFGQFNNGIFAYRKEDGEIIGENSFPGPIRSQNAEVRLYFRFSPAGKVWWDDVSLRQCPPAQPRPVKIACSWGTGGLDWWRQWLDVAGQKKVDIALLPEMFNGHNPDKPEPPNGPSATLLAEKARQWHIYATGCYYEKRGDIIYNTARLFDREGNPAGIYSKVHLYDPEEDEGVTPGTNLPVFNADFGKVAIMTCYDSWFPETARLLAYKGAELILLPNAGYYMGILPARAADNGVCIAVSSLNDPAGIWDSGGTMAGEKIADPTSETFSTISDYQKDDANRMIVATVDLSRRASPAWHGGPMHSAPADRRVRQNSIRPIEQDIAEEAARWWTNSSQ